ncbi:MAG: flagellar biosynthesis protein FlhB [Azospirillaceae bacterium]
MAEDQDDSQKTEEPTRKKLDDARNKGQVATSQEVKHWFVLFAGLLLIALFGPIALGNLVGGMRGYLTTLHALPTDPRALIDMMATSMVTITGILALPLIALVALALAGGLVQNGLLFTVEPLKPKLEKISPLKGLKRQFSLKSLVEFAKGIAKITIVGVVAGLIVWPDLAAIDSYAGLPAAALTTRIWWLAVKMMLAVLGVMAAIAGLDFLYQRFDYNKQQRMTKQEVKDEHKQTEGDPMVKARLRQIRQERARQRMMAAVPSADVVITNPTHYAVAMAYDPDSMGAPRVVAKGVDNLALKIREVAEANHVPVTENPPLARALYAAVEVDQEVPPEHYRAVAEVIAYVFKLGNRKLPPGAGATPAAGPRGTAP